MGELTKLLVVGNGMTSYRFLDLFVSSRGSEQFQITVVGEEPRPAYDRVHLTDYFAKSSADELLMAPSAWYRKNGIKLITGARGTAIHGAEKTVTLDSGAGLGYDILVLATGSSAFVPPIAGVDLDKVFVYRTIEDLDAIRACADTAADAVVIGGGLLGLEAARAISDMGVRASVVEYNNRLMGRQLDGTGAAMLAKEVEKMGVRVLLERSVQGILPAADNRLRLDMTPEPLDTDMVVISAGIRPRDELADAAGIAVGARGGIVVDDHLRTSNPDVYAIGECALHDGVIYGLVAPCYQMAEAAVATILGQDKRFTGADMSTTLKLMGVDVATVGESVLAPDTDPESFTQVTILDEIQGEYKKLIINKPENTLRGAILVGNTSDYSRLVSAYRNQEILPEQPVSLIVQGGAGGPAAEDLADRALVCTCNNVTKGQICAAIQEGCDQLESVCQATDAGSGCGGCKPQIKQILALELEKMGMQVKPHICTCFPFSRSELVDIVKVRSLESYDDVLAAAGTGNGCEICQPAVASILASIHGSTAAQAPQIQDTNDRYLANIQRGGTYSIVPRVPGGEITPQKLIRLGEIAIKYDLYTKITGGQRVDLFGASVDQLPDIWSELIAAGFESGHAYAKGLRTVKSCVGSTWCRFGLLDSTRFAIDLENRYKGIRAPHKLKSAVSGCIRECAEARCKDFGIIATEDGWNLYAGGNGGANPRHAELLAGGLDDATCIQYIDRFLMYYILTADPLTRTAAWLEQLDGGIDGLRSVIIDDSLGIVDKLDSDMETLVQSYQCEWTQVVNDPVQRSRFQSFANSARADSGIRFVPERDQKRPASGGGFVELQRIGKVPDDLNAVTNIGGAS